MTTLHQQPPASDRHHLIEERARLETKLAQTPDDAKLNYALGKVLGMLGQHRSAIVTFTRATELAPDFADAWSALAEQFLLTGNHRAAEDASLRQLEFSIHYSALRDAAEALKQRRFALAEQMLSELLRENPDDVNALKLSAEICINSERQSEAEHYLDRCLQIAPDFAAARYRYASVLYAQGKHAKASTQIDLLLANDPRNAQYRNLKAALFGLVGDIENALAWHRALVTEYPDQPAAWIAYGHALKAAGYLLDAIDAYRKSIALQPSLGGAYWSLANLKRFHFEDGDVAAMQQQLDNGDLSVESRTQFHFALGKALEDQGKFKNSFEHYKAGNDLWRSTVAYDSRQTTDFVHRAKALFSTEFFEKRNGFGADSDAPIFIVGMPRSGSTLVEQILASHSAVEATMELPHLIAVANEIEEKVTKGCGASMPEALSELDNNGFTRAAETYLAHVEPYRKLGRAHFIDKMPNNFAYIGLIYLILPNAKIIDVRRHPMACCFSNYKQHFAKGQVFTYRLTELGRYYRDYVALMAHYDTVLPDRIYRVQHEQLVENPEKEIAALLAYCGLPFEQSCISFYENPRAVLTPSSEQVRMPIYRDGLEHWRNFEPWLAPLKTALGPATNAANTKHSVNGKLPRS